MKRAGESGGERHQDIGKDPIRERTSYNMIHDTGRLISGEFTYELNEADSTFL